MSMLGMAPRADIARIVRTHQAGLWRYLRLLGCDDALADDLAQETFVVILRKGFDDYDQAATARYLRTTARFLFLKAKRAGRRMVAYAEVADLLWEEQAARDDGEGLVQALKGCIDTLDERQRRLIDLRYFKQAGRGEIASALGLSVMAVKSLLRRVKDTLRACVETKRRTP
ncbi:MAG: sigma-70 family RNA polymerase sigma factor [Planctomycetaceae bacterium]|nr:sigma-70 family RNA polymerase sigma factor [Planctomycetaceae bacterium]